jgi:hypothetical protein
MRAALSVFLFAASSFCMAADTAVTQTDAANSSQPSTNKAVQKLVGKATKAYPFFAILSEDVPGFRKSWETKTAISQLLLPKEGSQNTALLVGVTMALEQTDSYLSKADDGAANRYVAALSKLMSIGATDKEVCELMLPGTKSTIDEKASADLEARMADVFIDTLLPAVNDVITSGDKGEINILSKKELEPLVLPVILSMAEKHGPEAVKNLSSLDDTAVDSTKRCESMAWMMQGIVEQPEKERAMLARTLFSKNSRSAAGIE